MFRIYEPHLVFEALFVYRLASSDRSTYHLDSHRCDTHVLQITAGSYLFPSVLAWQTVHATLEDDT